MSKSGGGIFRRLGRAVGSVAAGYESEKDAKTRKEAQRIMLAVMADDPDASDKDTARHARKRIAEEHADDDDANAERVNELIEWVTPEAVGRLRRALAVAALERQQQQASTKKGSK